MSVCQGLRPPTAQHNQLPAMRMYVRAERLCDQQHSEGIRLMKRALALAWELGCEEWPSWVQLLYDQLHNSGSGAVMEAPVLATSESARDFQPELAAVRLSSECVVRVAGAVASALSARNFAVLDGFAGTSTAAELRGSLSRAHAEGLLQPADVSPPGEGLGGTRSFHLRSDCIAWVDVTDERQGDDWRALSAVVGLVDSLVRTLATVAPELGGAGATRRRPMVSRYGEGAAFARHCDNHCEQGEGPLCNGRWLTAVYYCNEWPADGGGVLRLFRPQTTEHVSPPGPGHAAPPELPLDDTLCEIPPLNDRLVLFFSDFRCPHEVTPVTSQQPRFATTLWYMQPTHS